MFSLRIIDIDTIYVCTHVILLIIREENTCLLLATLSACLVSILVFFWDNIWFLGSYNNSEFHATKITNILKWIWAWISKLLYILKRKINLSVGEKQTCTNTYSLISNMTALEKKKKKISLVSQSWMACEQYTRKLRHYATTLENLRTNKRFHFDLEKLWGDLVYS